MVSPRRAISVRTASAALLCASLLGGCAVATDPTVAPTTPAEGSHEPPDLGAADPDRWTDAATPRPSRPAWTPSTTPPTARTPDDVAETTTEPERGDQRLGIRDTVTIEIEGP